MKLRVDLRKESVFALIFQRVLDPMTFLKLKYH